MQIEEPRLHKIATGEPVQDEGFRALPIVTEDGLHRCMNFRVAPVHKAQLSAFEGVPVKVITSSWISEHG